MLNLFELKDIQLSIHLFHACTHTYLPCRENIIGIQFGHKCPESNIFHNTEGLCVLHYHGDKGFIQLLFSGGWLKENKYSVTCLYLHNTQK